MSDKFSTVVIGIVAHCEINDLAEVKRKIEEMTRVIYFKTSNNKLKIIEAEENEEGKIL